MIHTPLETQVFSGVFDIAPLQDSLTYQLLMEYK